MRALTLITIITISIYLASCSSTYDASAPYDEVYATSRESSKSTPETVTVRSQPVESTTSYEGDYYAPEYEEGEFESDEYYDYEYSSRLKRFHNDNPGFDYYSNYYTDNYYYSGDPYYMGSSIYGGYGCCGPSVSLSFGFGYGWGYPSYYTPWYYDPWYYPYYGYGWGWGYGYPGYWGGSYWAGYNDGYWNGYWDGYYGGGGYYPITEEAGIILIPILTRAAAATTATEATEAVRRTAAMLPERRSPATRVLPKPVPAGPPEWSSRRAAHALTKPFPWPAPPVQEPPDRPIRV